MRKDIIVSDLDGTIALDEHRAEQYLRQRVVRDWNGYYDAVEKDEPNTPVIELLQSMWANNDHAIHILSGRVERTRAQTTHWLKKWSVPYDKLILRPDDSREQDTTLKIKWAREMNILDRILFVLEDRNRMVEAWRAAGVPCFQVAVGNF